MDVKLLRQTVLFIHVPYNKDSNPGELEEQVIIHKR